MPAVDGFGGNSRYDDDDHSEHSTMYHHIMTTKALMSPNSMRLAHPIPLSSPSMKCHEYATGSNYSSVEKLQATEAEMVVLHRSSRAAAGAGAADLLLAAADGAVVDHHHAARGDEVVSVDVSLTSLQDAVLMSPAQYYNSSNRKSVRHHYDNAQLQNRLLGSSGSVDDSQEEMMRMASPLKMEPAKTATPDRTAGTVERTIVGHSNIKVIRDHGMEWSLHQIIVTYCRIQEL
jgi:hypothetical protein